MKETQTTRVSKTGAKGSSDTTRNTDGIAIVEEVYEPGEVQIGEKKIEGFYRFNLEQLEFLKEYAKDCDYRRASTAVGVPTHRAKQWLTKEKFKAEIEEIHDVWRLNIKMTAENAAATHIKLMKELERDYSQADLDQRAKFASSRVKASDTYLKAAGHFNHGGTGAGDSQIVINIDLGDAPAVEVEKGGEVARVAKVEKSEEENGVDEGG